MGNTYSHLLVHLVFATKNRIPTIAQHIAERLHEYIGGIARAEGCALLAAGGVEDHVHLLMRIKPDLNLATLMRDIKGKSSRWINVTFPDSAWRGWQDGYAAFSVSRSAESHVREYLANQREHHLRRSFRDELEELLRRHGVEYDTKYLE